MQSIRRFLAFSISTALLAFALPALAQGRPPGRPAGPPHGPPPHGAPPGRPPHRQSIPEFDPAAVSAIGVVIAGGALVIARRRKR